jgi:hypothetical protein
VACNVTEFGESVTIQTKYRLHHQSARVSQARKENRSRREGFISVSVVFSLGLVLEPESGDRFLRNFALTPNCMMLNPKERALHYIQN